MKQQLILSIFVLTTLAACSNEENGEGGTVVGSDRDEHGCIASAGYQWCEQSGQCERPWELAEREGFQKNEAAFKAFCKNYGKELTLAFEPGKFLVSEAGYFLTKVNAVKQTTSTVFAQVDSGFNHLIRPMLYGSQHEIINISNENGKQK